jgi:hypothetical protein
MESIVTNMCKGSHNQNKSGNAENRHHSVQFCSYKIVVSLRRASQSDKMNIVQCRRTIAKQKKEDGN